MKIINYLTLLAVLFLSTIYTQAAPININQASVSEITENLKGIGEKKAQKIIEYRTQHGPFITINDLLKVTGIGEKLLEMIQNDLIRDKDTPEKLAQ